MKSNNNNVVATVVIVTTLATCGLMIPVWLIVGLIALLIKWIAPPPVVKKPEVKYIPPSNDFVSDWEFEIKEI